jgi:transposase-like protein
MIPIRVTCPICNAYWQLEDGDVELAPFPHFTCLDCGTWIRLF